MDFIASKKIYCRLIEILYSRTQVNKKETWGEHIYKTISDFCLHWIWIAVYEYMCV